MEEGNLLFIMADEHARDVLGCYGHATARTPHLDRLAAAGTRFGNAYTPSPMCVPARASLQTGRWVHDIGCWSSAEPYDGRIRGWGHRLVEGGHRVVSVGKLHFRSSEDDNGFDTELLPLHVLDGVGWVPGLLRDPLPDYSGPARELAEQVGEGETSYTRYDSTVCERACRWLREDGSRARKPWVLFVSFVCPHYPFIAPAAFHAGYTPEMAGLPHRHRERHTHPVLAKVQAFYNYADHFSDQRMREARAAYLALCSYTDHHVGRLLASLSDCGLEQRTRVLYTSDHGEMQGDHGLWTKMTMHEGAAAIPMILAGPDVPAGVVVDTPVSLVDCHQTILRGAGIPAGTDEAHMPGRSLFDIAAGAVPARTVISEFHDGGSPSGYFMLRDGAHKYVHYAAGPPQLFDLAADPLEDIDLAAAPQAATVLDRCEARLRSVLDPAAVNTRAFADQARRIEALGGRARLLAMSDRQFGYTPIDA